MALTIIVLVAVVDVLAFLASFFGLVSVAQWMLLVSWQVVLLPLVLDGAIMILTGAAAIYRARGHSTFLLWSGVAFFTLLSVGANVLHVLFTSTDPNVVHVWVGAFLAGVMPASVWVLTHVLVNLVIKKVEAKDSIPETVAKPVRIEAGQRKPKTVSAAAPEPTYLDLDTSK